MTKLTKSIQELNYLTKEVSLIVELQGNMLENVEANSKQLLKKKQINLPKK